eukprot:15342851-Ditylum_brightwellii.AAC.1
MGICVCCANSLAVMRKLITPRTKLTRKLKKLQKKERNVSALTILTPWIRNLIQNDYQQVMGTTH